MRGDRRLRAAVPARVVARDRREARRRQGRDRGDDQDLGRRRALRAHRRGQRPGQRARRARCATRSPRSTRTCATSSSSTSRSASSTRATAPARSRACCIDASDGHDVWGSIGVDENVIAASWQALVDSLEYAEQPGAPDAPPAADEAARARRERGRRATEPIPLARPVLGEAEERAVARGAALAASCRSARACRRSSRRSRARLGAAHASAVSSGTAGLHLALRAVGVSDGDEVVTSPFSFVASANVVRLRARAPGVRRHRPGDAEPRPDGGRAPRSPTARRALLPVHIFGYPADMPAFEALGLPIVEDACEALGAVHADGIAVGARGHPAVFGFYANKQLTTGEGGMVTIGDAGDEGAHRLRAQPGPRARHGLARPRPPRLQLPPLATSRARSGLAQLERLDDMLAGRARVAALLPRGARRHRGPRRCRAPDAGGDVRGWFVFVVQVPRGADRDDVVRALRERGVQSKPYLPAIHLMSLLPRALRPPRGRVPGLRGRRRALARAAVLPGDDRRAGRAGRDGACTGARPDA